MSDVKVWRYARGGNGWFVAFVDEIGCVSIQSDYGDYAYRWFSFGDDIRTFLMQCNDSYLRDKFTYGRPRVVKGEESIKRFKETILDDRRQGGLSKKKARELYDAVPEYLDDGFSSNDLEAVLADWLSNDCWETVVCEKEYNQVNAFLEKCWPDVIKQMEESVELDEYCK